MCGWRMQVVAEVYAAQDVVVKPHILLSLVLYKIVDPAQVGCHPLQSCHAASPPLLYSMSMVALTCNSFISSSDLQWPECLANHAPEGYRLACMKAQ